MKTPLTETEAAGIAMMRLRATVKTLGWTASLVHRGGTTSNNDLLCTIDAQPGDIVFARITGRKGIYIA